MAKELAYDNAAISNQQMMIAAGLELGNQSSIMQQEFNYGMAKLGTEYDLQSKFATDDANRELTKLAFQGDILQNQTQLEGEQNRLNLQEQGAIEQSLQDKKIKAQLSS